MAKEQISTVSYLILHSKYGGDLHRDWQVIRCWYANEDQELLFSGPRENAKAFLYNHWDDKPCLGF